MLGAFGPPYAGILAIQNQPRGAIAWAWGMNGIFAAVGGLLSALLSLEEGFNVTILVALACYVAALSVFARMRDTAPALERLSAAYPTIGPAPAPASEADEPAASALSAEASSVFDREAG